MEECLISAALRDGRPHQGMDELFWRKDGSSFHVEYNCSPIREDGRLVGSVLIYKDMTERRMAEEQLLKLSQAVMQSPVSIIITDPLGDIEFVNPRFSQSTGYEAEDVIGRNPRLLQGGRTSSELYRNLWDTITSGRIWTGELYNRHKNGGTHWEHATISPIRNGAGTISHYMAFMESISERKRLEEQLRQSQKMEAIGQLAGGVAHDFNNILTVIMGFGQLLQHSLPAGDPRHEHMEQILDAADRATHLTRSLLAFSRKQVMMLQQVELNGLTRKHAKFLVRIIGEDVALKTRFTEERLLVMADSGQMEQVLMNLATNAYHAMEENGGELKISLNEVELGEHDRMNHDLASGLYACLTVSDTGKGMNKDIMKNIFDPFFTTKERGKGTGMGLSVVHGIVKNMNGAIKVYSEPGNGTEFQVYLPIVKSNFETQEIQSKEPLQSGTEQVLLVDDEESIIVMEKQVLERLGYQVTSHTSSIEALEVFKADPKKFDIIISDVSMPKMPGDKLAVEMIKIRPGIPILLCTGYSKSMTDEKTKSLGIKGFIEKPIVIKDLARKIREVLDKAPIKIQQ